MTRALSKLQCTPFLLLFLEWKAIGAVCFHKSFPAACFLRSFMAFFFVRWITPGLHNHVQNLSSAVGMTFQHSRSANSKHFESAATLGGQGIALAPGDHLDLAAALRFMVLDPCCVCLCLCLCLCCLRLPRVNIHASCLLLILRPDDMRCEQRKGTPSQTYDARRQLSVPPRIHQFRLRV